MKLSKLEAAQRQLNAAIDLYFESGDEVATHTLAGAAYTLVTDLNGRARNIDELLKFIKPKNHEDFRKRWNKPQNFFKHANRDPEAILDFNPQMTEIVLLMACEEYGELGERSDQMYLFAAWFMLQNPDALNANGAAIMKQLSPRWAGHSRTSFRKSFRSVVQELRATPNGPR